MYCKTVNECFQEINAYCAGKPWGYPLLVNMENFNDFQTVLQRLEADASKQCIFVSQFTQKNGLPIIDDAIAKITGKDDYVMVGASHAAMLRNETVVDALVDELLGLSISGHAIVLLNHCKKFIDRYLQRDPRYDRRVILVEGSSSPLPQIKLIENEAVCVGFKPLNGIQGLLKYMEKMDDAKLQAHPTLTVLTSFKTSLFRQSLYSVTESTGIYDAVCQKYPDLVLTKNEYGTQEQWGWLLNAMEGFDTFSAFVCSNFGATSNLISHLDTVLETGDKNKLWLLWLAMQVFGVGTNKYVTRIIANSDSVDTFERSLYNELLNIKHDDPMFDTYYAERKRILDAIPENLPYIDDYCDQIGMHEKYAVCYLTASSERERYELVKSLSIYDYSEDEIGTVLKNGFPDIYSYMQLFTFDVLNTKLPDADCSLRGELTDYFAQYKQQKLTNRIFDGFISKVDSHAVDRPFMKLQPRSSIVSKLDKDKTGFFFFDALGVEYLAFIQSKCEKYGLVSEFAIARCELPSITSTNKEFENTCPNVKKISELDELKHHSMIYDYAICPYPIHLFRELEIIDTELRRIQTQLTQGIIEKAVILSDHGASRLAVLYGKESASNIELSEKGIHSGRCCKIDEDPKLPQVSYEDGYAVLANYERFKGSRAANLEVHGGATLEEVIVPIITLVRKPENITYCFVDPVIKFKVGQDAKIILFSNMPMSHPRLQVNNIFYEGTFIGDKKHAQFVMPELKRTNSYEAIVYDGEKNVGVTLNFSIERATKQKNLFGL
ncbi:MAG: BREX-4 system phosphatase PglZ [Anaerotignum lactatifermentans]|jgi:hypothetical protein